jgi:hypothetical protein
VCAFLRICLNVYSCANISTLKPLKLKQKEAIRIISNVGYRDHTGPLFKRLAILPLDEFIKYAQLKFMHSFFHKKLPISFNETWISNRARNPEIALRTTLPPPKDPFIFYAQSLE